MRLGSTQERVVVIIRKGFVSVCCECWERYDQEAYRPQERRTQAHNQSLRYLLVEPEEA